MILIFDGWRGMPWDLFSSCDLSVGEYATKKVLAETEFNTTRFTKLAELSLLRYAMEIVTKKFRYK